MKADRRRQLACAYAAQVMQGRGMDGDIACRVWSLTVYFETYMAEGSEGTRKDFGFKRPPRLKIVR